MHATPALARGLAEQARTMQSYGYADVTVERVRQARDRWRVDAAPIDVVDRYCYTAFDDAPAVFGTMDML